MEIFHHIAFHSTEDVDFISKLDKFKIRYKQAPSPGGKSSIIAFDIYESNDHWPEIAQFIQKINPVDLVETVFSSEEILKAKWLRLMFYLQKGYPQPEDDWVTNPSESEILCPNIKHCGIRRQVRQYRIKNTLRIKDDQLFTLFWSHNPFCSPKIIKELNENNIKGFQDWETIIHTTNKPSDNIRQIYIPRTANPGLIDDGLEKSVCYKCESVKYKPHVRGIMHLKKDSLLPDLDFQLTNEFFGSGGTAFREIIVSNRLAKLILNKGWKGVRFKVVEELL